MNKVLVNVFVPVLNTSYDVFVPLQLQIFEARDLIKEAVTELSEGRFIAMKDAELSFRLSGEMLDANSTVFEMGIKNATKLMLI